MRRAPARPVRSCFARTCCAVASKNITCTRPRCNATPNEHFLHASNCTLHKHYAHMNNHSLQKDDRPIDDETTPAAPAAHTRYLSSPAAATLHGKTQGFVLRLSRQRKAPRNIHVAITMRSATKDTTNAKNYAHMNNQSLQNTEEEPIRRWNNPSRTCRTHEVPVIAGCSHFTRKNTRGRAPASSPNQGPCNIHAAITLRSATRNPNTQRTTHTWTTTRCRTQRRNQFDDETTPAAPAAHTRYLSSPTAATLHGKTQGVVLRLPPQIKAHATFMQPLHYDLQPEIPKRRELCTSLMWCHVSHHPSLSIASQVLLLCDIKFHTILLNEESHKSNSYVMYMCRPPCIEYSFANLIVMCCKLADHPASSIVSQV